MFSKKVQLWKTDQSEDSKELSRVEKGSKEAARAVEKPLLKEVFRKTEVQLPVLSSKGSLEDCLERNVSTLLETKQGKEDERK